MEGCLAITQPREYFVVERIDYFYFVVVGICYRYHVFVRYKTNTKRVLKFSDI